MNERPYTVERYVDGAWLIDADADHRHLAERLFEMISARSEHATRLAFRSIISNDMAVLAQVGFPREPDPADLAYEGPF